MEVRKITDYKQFQEELSDTLELSRRRAEGSKQLDPIEQRGITAVWHTGRNNRFAVKLFAGVAGPCFFVYDADRWVAELADETDLDMLVYQSKVFHNTVQMAAAYTTVAAYIASN